LADYRGKLVIIEFMRTDCPHCQALTAQLAEVKAKFGDRVSMLYIMNPPDNQTTAARYMSEHKVQGPMLFDCGQVTASFVRATPSNPSVALPQLFLIDGTGTIRSHSGGESNPAELEAKSISNEVQRILGTPDSKKK
jgi:thiol-disulfide isomerase/thioredoxin